MNSIKLKVHIALFLVALIYAIVFSIARDVMVIIPPFTLIVIRIGVSLILFCLIFFFNHYKMTIENRDWGLLFLSGITGVGANMLLFFNGLAHTTPINGAILMTNTPVFVVLIAGILKIERLHVRKILGIILASTGSTLLIAGLSLNFSSKTFFGDLMVAVNAILYSVYLIFVKSLIHKYNTIRVSVITFSIGFMFTLPFGFDGFKHIDIASIPNFVWIKTTFIIVVASFITYLLNAWALANGSASLVGSYIYLQPIMATLIAEFLGKDQLSWEKSAYMLLVLSGVYLVSASHQKQIIYESSGN